jgi:TP901 family phage tail tape measure protein
MAANASRVSLFIEGIDQFSDPLRKAREQIRYFTREYDQAGAKLKDVNKNIGRIEKIQGLTKALGENKEKLTEVTDKLKLLELAEQKGLLTQKKSFDLLKALRAERDGLNGVIQRSESLVEKETSALKEQGFAVDKLAEHYDELQKSKVELGKVRESESVKIKDLREREEEERFKKSLEKDKEEQRSARKQQSLEYFATAGALGYSSSRVLGAARSPIASAMEVEAGINDVIAKGLFEQMRGLSPEQKASMQGKAQEDLRSQAMRLGAELPGYGAMDVVKLQQKAITQGIDLKDLSDDFLKQILQFALVDKLDTGNAFDIVNSMRKSYGMGLDKTQYLTDLIAYTSIKSSASTDEIGKAFKEVQGLSAAVNVAPENMASFAAILADKGNIKGERAGTQMKNILTALIVQDNETAKKLTEMGLTFTDEKGNLEDPVKIIGKIAEKTQGWGDANLSKLLVGLGNEEAITAFSTILRTYNNPSERGELTAIQDAVKSGQTKGTVKEVTEGLTKGLNPAIEELTGNWENLKTAIGTPVLESMTNAIKLLSSGLESLANWFKENPLAGKIAIWGIIATAVTLAAAAVGFFVAGLVLIAPIALEVAAAAAGVAAGIAVTVAQILAFVGGIILVFKFVWWVIKSVWGLIEGFFKGVMTLIKAVFGGAFQQSPNLAQDENGRFYTKAPPSLTDKEVVERYKAAQKEKTKDLFRPNANFNADITVNVQSDAKDPKAIGRAVKDETVGGFNDMNARFFDFEPA